MLLNRFLFLRFKKPKLAYYSTSKTEDFELIYSCNYARLGSLLNKVKLQQTFLTSLALPATYGLEMLNIIPTNYFYAASVIALAVNAVSYSVGQLCYNLIGKAYINQDSTLLRLSTVGFYGKRVENVVPIDNVYLNDTCGKLYTILFVENPNRKFKIQEKYFDYCNMPLARRAFGESFCR